MKRRDVIRLAAAALSAALLLGGCSSGTSNSGASTSGSSTSASGASVEEASTFDEGVNTACKVSYTKYKGKNEKMFLSSGDKVAVISPSAIPTRKQVDLTVEGLKKWGYVPVEGQYVCKDPRTLEEIRKDLEWALKDPDIKGIFCVRGGYGASEVMDIVPEELIASSGKIIIGYSDISVYHSAWTAAGLPSIQACMSGTFDDLDEKCVEAEEKILKGEIPSYTCEGAEYCLEGKAKGVLIGGNLSTFTSVLSSAYDCTKTGKPYIIFLEDVGEDIQHIHRYLTVLKHYGVLDRAEGIIFGEWTETPVDMDDYSGSSRGGTFKSVGEMISRQIVKDMKKPVAFGFPAGHGDKNYPLLMGEEVSLEVKGNSYTISW